MVAFLLIISEVVGKVVTVIALLMTVIQHVSCSSEYFVSISNLIVTITQGSK